MPTTTSMLTPESELQLSFDSSLIPQASKDLLPSDIIVRPLASDDYNRGHLRVLSDLTQAPDVGLAAWSKQFALQLAAPNTYYPIVFINTSTDQIVACGTVFVEYKFLRSAGLCGHIEDIVVHNDGQGKGLGKRIIEILTHIAKERGCYKVILDCSEKNVPFYEKCGYHKAGEQMAIYYV
ncbi:glucosamine 6-phosphate [Moesziomyces antarcticus]|uniref:Related to glucosamine 6-phosphate n-acetyltransferase n=2 Tax=Pseudozyma antarctica TaxID=84753 RepID=A0A5C3FPR9_PSEA2|nr:glucosamine 6-phosphate [Moesziomyces antarcticus]GAK65868.1 glucosamine 6-phosphate [Moesziomyces antarcticus]SPO45497.1 related to glucosamine 6-phosphate n-acetyltransferase [Moesziomyces antarcticus]